MSLNRLTYEQISKKNKLPLTAWYLKDKHELNLLKINFINYMNLKDKHEPSLIKR